MMITECGDFYVRTILLYKDQNKNVVSSSGIGGRNVCVCNRCFISFLSFSLDLSLLTCSNLSFPCLVIRNCIRLAAELVTESALVLNCTLLSRNLCSCWLSVGFVDKSCLSLPVLREGERARLGRCLFIASALRQIDLSDVGRLRLTPTRPSKRVRPPTVEGAQTRVLSINAGH